MLNNPIRVIFLAALALGFVLTSANASAANINASLRYVPNDSYMVAGMHGDRVQTTSLYKTLVKLALQEKEIKDGLAEFKTATGFDATKDVRSVVVAASPKRKGEPDNFVVIVDAKLSEAKLLAFLKSKKAKLETVKTAQGTHHLLGSGRHRGFLAFRGQHVLIGGAAMMPRVMRKQGPKPSVAVALSKVKNRHLFIAMEPTADIRKKWSRQQKELADLRLLTAGLDLTRGAVLTSDARFASAASAKSLEKLAKDSMAQMSGSRQAKKMGMDQMVKGVKLQRVGSTLRGSVKLSQKQVDDLLTMASKFL